MSNAYIAPLLPHWITSPCRVCWYFCCFDRARTVAGIQQPRKKRSSSSKLEELIRYYGLGGRGTFQSLNFKILSRVVRLLNTAPSLLHPHTHARTRTHVHTHTGIWSRLYSSRYRPHSYCRTSNAPTSRVMCTWSSRRCLLFSALASRSFTFGFGELRRVQTSSFEFDIAFTSSSSSPSIFVCLLQCC